MTKIEAIADYVIFKQEITKNDAGILLPDSAKDLDLCRNIVVSVGEDVNRVKVGDEIILLQKTASKLHFPERKVEENLLIVKEENIIALMKEE